MGDASAKRFDFAHRRRPLRILLKRSIQRKRVNRRCRSVGGGEDVAARIENVAVLFNPAAGRSEAAPAPERGAPVGAYRDAAKTLPRYRDGGNVRAVSENAGTHAALRKEKYRVTRDDSHVRSLHRLPRIRGERGVWAVDINAFDAHRALPEAVNSRGEQKYEQHGEREREAAAQPPPPLCNPLPRQATARGR